MMVRDGTHAHTPRGIQSWRYLMRATEFLEQTASQPCEVIADRCGRPAERVLDDRNVIFST